MQHNPQIVRLALAGLLSVALLVIVGMSLRDNAPSHDPSDVSAAAQPDLREASRRIARAVSPSVVTVTTQRDKTLSHEELVQLFGPDDSVLSTQGSGVCIAPGMVLTNYHVVAEAQTVTVRSAEASTSAEIVGVDALTDLAVLRVTADLPAATWGDSESLSVGDFVWALGTPYGLNKSLTMGIVSALNQPGSASVHQEFLQTDAAVNPGSSGGPLVNEAGEVIGINTAILGNTFQGISFAVPSATARRISAELMRAGRVDRGWLGVRTQTATGGTRVTGFANKGGQPSPGRAAGIRVGDLLTHWNKHFISGATQLARFAAQAEPGSVITVTLMREQEQLQLPVTIRSKP